MTSDDFTTVVNVFKTFLESRKLRKTHERGVILKEIYAISGHFDIELLYKNLKQKKHRISKATLYNNVELLIDAGLIIKHQFGKNSAQYERSYKYKQHDHLICNDCQTVFEFCDPRVIHIQQSTSKLLNFNIDRHALHFYGSCRALLNNGTCPYKVK